MKRLALLMILGVVAFSVARHIHAGPPRSWARPHRPAATTARLASFGPRADEPPAHPAPPAPKKKAARRAEPKAAPTPAAAAEPKRQPDWFPRDLSEEEALARPDARGVLVLIGPRSATEEQARKSLSLKVKDAIDKWLSGDVPPSWDPPAEAVARMTLAGYVQPVVESLGDVSKDLDELYTLYRAGARLDFSPARRAEILGLYEHDLVRQRMAKGGALLAFVLFALAVLSGYIRADESTKGYYTNRLRMLAAAGVGAAGVVAYRLLA